jgi:hypothetical protein
MAFAKVIQKQLLFQSVYNLPASQRDSWPSWDIAQCWFGIFTDVSGQHVAGIFQGQQL